MTGIWTYYEEQLYTGSRELTTHIFLYLYILNTTQ